MDFHYELLVELVPKSMPTWTLTLGRRRIIPGVLVEARVESPSLGVAFALPVADSSMPSVDLSQIDRGAVAGDVGLDVWVCDGLWHEQIEPPAEEPFESFLEAEVGIEPRPTFPVVEFNEEVQVAPRVLEVGAGSGAE